MIYQQGYTFPAISILGWIALQQEQLEHMNKYGVSKWKGTYL